MFRLPGILMGGIYVFESALGWLPFEGGACQAARAEVVIRGLIVYLLAFVLTGYGEELISRGYQLQTLATGLNLPLAVFISSAIFAALPLANPGASWASVLGVLGAAGSLASALVGRA